MRPDLAAFRAGAVGLIATSGVLLTEPMLGYLLREPYSWVDPVLLYGFPILAGVVLLAFTEGSLPTPSRGKDRAFRALVLGSTLWLWLWCFTWLGMAAGMGDQGEMIVKHLGYLHLFGVGFTLAACVMGWMARGRLEGTTRSMMGTGWAVSYMAWVNLTLQPGLKFLWGPAVGGLLVVLGVFLVYRRSKSRVEAAPPGA